MDLGLQGRSLIGQDFGCTVALTFTGGYDIRIEADFTVHANHGDTHISPGVDDAAEKHVGALHHQKVTTAVATGSGTLIISFDDGTHLRVEPDDTYEAWTLAGPHGMKIACMPDGELAIWSANNHQQ